MITLPTKKIKNKIEAEKSVELKAVSKKYPSVKIKNTLLNKNFSEFWALRDISFNVYQGEILGIIGRNGAGKTTLLGIITGALSSTQGQVYKKGKTLGLFNLGVGFQDELSGKDNIFLNGAILGASRKEIESKLNSIINFSELGEFINMPLGTYSQGMRLRLAFSIIANLDFDILVIDEVLAVGDALFQSKCFQRLMDFKRAGKTLIITSQGMELVERFCDKVALIDHGSLLFSGNVKEGINRYLALLNTDAFFVGPEKKQTQLFNNTKKWADNIVDWGKKFGTKEVEIESVEFINKFGWKSNKIKSGSPLKIKVNFKAKNEVKEPHFGVAIFRNDGVYCYGPNTSFDGYRIPELREGRGYFILNYHKLLLAPGEYVISLAIWDENESLAFDHHFGCYKLLISADHAAKNELLAMPVKFDKSEGITKLGEKHNNHDRIKLFNSNLKNNIGVDGIKLESINFLNAKNEKKYSFMTNEFVKIRIDFSELRIERKSCCLRLGIFRDDGVFCQSMAMKINKEKSFSIVFPKLPLLPGGYKVSFGIWGISSQNYLAFYHEIYKFNIFFNKEDHGTVYLEHAWQWRLPK